MKFLPGTKAELSEGSAVIILDETNRWYRRVGLLMGPVDGTHFYYVTFGRKSKYPYTRDQFIVVLPEGEQIL